MTDGPVLAIIPARSGSKGIPGKNTRRLAGRPLLQYAVDAARGCPAVDRTIVSTDSPAIAELGQAAGAEVPFLRPPELAQDDTPMVPVLVHAVGWVESHGWFPEIIVLLQPTAPLRRPEHVAAAITLLRRERSDSVASVVEVPRHHSPDYVMQIDQGRLRPFLPQGERVTRRQDARPAYVRDGTVYAVRRDVLMNASSLYGRDCRPLILPSEDTLTLDTPRDWEEAERRLAQSARTT